VVGGAEMCAVGGGERNRMLKEVEGGGMRDEGGGRRWRWRRWEDVGGVLRRVGCIVAMIKDSKLNYGHYWLEVVSWCGAVRGVN